ncbi:MAG: hypothetical protein ABI610_00400 [Acidobacteriota bacterium]
MRVEGRFRLPHGDVAVSVGDRYDDPYYGGGHYGYSRYPVGSYVPYGYRVIQRPRLGYGFASPAFACRAHRVHHSHWVPVRRVRTRWVVVQQPVLAVEEGYGRRYDRGYDRGYDRRYDDRYPTGRRYRDDRPYRDEPVYGEDPYYDFNREYWDRSYGPGARQHVHSDSCGHHY